MSRQSYITPPCPVCGKTSELDVSAAEYLAIRAWENGAIIQDVLPHWSPEQRELVKTGWHDEHWPKDPDDE